MNWMNAETMYENSLQNSIYKIINSQDEHYFKYYLTHNRNIRNFCQNKVGPHDVSMGQSPITQRSYLYQAINIFNKLPRNVTLIRNQNLFKKWCRKYNMNNAIKLRYQPDNMLENPIQTICHINIDRCINAN